MQNRRRHAAVPGGCHPNREAFAAMDNYRNCVKDQIQFLRQENHEMRIRLSKLDEIESRVEVLIVRDQQNVRELELLRQSLHEKACEIEDLKHCIELEKHSSMQKEAALKGDMQALLSEVGWIHKDRQEADLLVEKKFEQVKAISARQIENAKLQVVHIQQQGKMEIDRLQQTIRSLTIQIEDKDRENNAVRLRMMDELQQLATRNDQLTRQNACINEQNCAMRTDLSGLVAELQQLKKAHQTLTVDKLRSDQQRAQLIIDLKEVQRQLGASLRDTRSMEEQCMERDAEINRLCSLNQQMSRHCEDIEDQLRKKNRLLDDFNNQLRKEEDSHRQQFTEMTAKLMNLEKERDTGRFQISSLSQRLERIHHQSDAKTVEIRDLLYAIEKLQEKLLSFEAKCRALENDNNMTAEKLTFMDQQRESQCFELRSMQQKLLLKEDHIRQLQDILQAERNCKIMKEKQLQQMKRMMGNPQQIARKYQEQMLRMIRLFQDEKMAIQSRFNNEKLRLKQVYEYELKDTQDLFERKMRVLQEQLKA